MGWSARIPCAVCFVAMSVCAGRLDASEPAAPSGTPSRSTLSDYQSISQLLDQGDAKAAVKALAQRGVSLSPGDRSLLDGRAKFLLQQISPARRALKTAIRETPKRAVGHYWLGRVYQADGAHSLASLSFHRAYSLGLDSADLHLYWAVSLRAGDATLGDVRQTDWKSQTDASPRVGDFVRDGIVVRDVRGRPDRVILSPVLSAVYQIENARLKAPRRPDVLLLAGELWAEVDQHIRAVKLFRQALANFGEPSEPAQRVLLARCHGNYAASALALGRLESYLLHERQQMELTGGVDPVLLAECYEKASREASARGSLSRQIRYLTLASEYQTTPARLIQLADVLLVAHRTEDAHQCLTRAMASRPTREERIQIRSRLARTSFLSATPAARP